MSETMQQAIAKRNRRGWTSFEDELFAHSAFAKDITRGAVVRKGLIAHVLAQVRNWKKDAPRVLVLHGSEGCGKTTLIAMLMRKLGEERRKEANEGRGEESEECEGLPVVMTRFLGQTSCSSGVVALLTGLCKQLGTL